MKELNRRGFMKAFLASAAGITVLHNQPAGSESLWAADADSNFETIASGGQQLRVSGAGELLSFQNLVLAGTDWKPATLTGGPVITGPSFPLMTSRVTRQDANLISEGNATAQGLDGKPLQYQWRTEIAPITRGEGDWFRFRTTLHLPAPIRLQQGSRVEPQIIIWLNKNSTLMEGQSGSWRRVHL